MGWEMVKLGDVAEVVTKKVPGENLDPATPYFGLEHLKTGGGILGNSRADAFSLKGGKPVFESGDILFGRLRPNLRKAAIASAPGTCSGDITILRMINGDDTHYLLHFLLSGFAFAQINRHINGINLPRINNRDLLEIKVPLPPLEEQQRIATILGTVEEARTKQDALVSELSSLEIAVCDAIFSAATEQIRLKEIADLQGGLTLSKRRKDNPFEVNYLRVGNVQRRSLELSTVKTIRCKENEIQRCELRKGDVLLVEANANPYEVGRAAQVPEFDTPTVYQNHLFRARPKNDVHPDYLEQAINSMPVRRQLVALARTTSGLNGFSISQARSLKIPLLSQQMQAELADRVSGFRQARFLQEEKAHRLNELYVSLSSRAFAGEL